GLAIARFGSKPSMLAMSGGAVIRAVGVRALRIGPPGPAVAVIGLLPSLGGVNTRPSGARLARSGRRTTPAGWARSGGGASCGVRGTHRSDLESVRSHMVAGARRKSVVLPSRGGSDAGGGHIIGCDKTTHTSHARHRDSTRIPSGLKLSDARRSDQFLRWVRLAERTQRYECAECGEPADRP